jgi:2-keto-4-pentenoate hydratase
MNEAVEPVAAALMNARRAHQPVPRAALEPLLHSADQAYAVQDIVAREFDWFSQAFPRFWKSGGPSRSTPLTHAPLPPANVWNSPADARQVHFNVRFIEAEIALRTSRDVTSAQAKRLNHNDLPSLIDSMTVSIEIVDSRWEQLHEAGALLKLADLQSHGGLVLGPWRPYSPRDWAAQPCSVEIGSRPAKTFRGTHSLGAPEWVLPEWLRHATRHGATAPAGTVVTTGTWCGLLAADAGDRVLVRFEGVGEAELQL